MDTRSLTDVINEAITELNPQAEDIQQDGQDEDLVDLDSVGDPDEEELEVESSDIEEDGEEGEEQVSDDDDTEKFVVKVDGEELEVSLEELKSGYSRQAHFTRKMQELKEERAQFEEEVNQVSETLTQIEQLDAAWEANPVSVLTQLISSTENPAQSLGYLIREMAVYDLLPAEALEYFGIDSEAKESWSKESELERLRRELQEREEFEKRTGDDYRVQQAMQDLENQIREIISDESIEFGTQADEARFRADLLGYAKDSGITDLKKAYAAMAYERSKTAPAAQRKPKASPNKEATRAVSRRGAGAGGVTPVRNGKQDLRGVIEQTMKEMNLY